MGGPDASRGGGGTPADAVALREAYRLADALRPELLALARGVVGDEGAEDVVEAASGYLLGRLFDLEPSDQATPGEVGQYVRLVVRRFAVDFLRRRAARAGVGGPDESLLGPPPGDVDLLLTRDAPDRPPEGSAPAPGAAADSNLSGRLYEKLRRELGFPSPADPVPTPDPAVPPPIQQSEDAFAADLPALLATAPARWVAYGHGRRLRVADTQTELYRYCLNDLGLRHDEFIVRCVVPDGGDEVEATPR